jgi:CBS domain-containing protein
LAYYFSKDNLQAASQTTLDAVAAAGGTTTQKPVNDVMIPLNRIRPREDAANDSAAKALLLRGLYEKMQSSGMSRVPVFADEVVLYVIHEPDIDRYAQAKGVTCSDLADTDTLGELIKDAVGAKAVSTFAAVSSSATVADARAALSKEAEAKDLFVTEDGTKTGKVLGWLTNSDLARSA